MNHTASWVRDFSSLKMRSEKWNPIPKRFPMEICPLTHRPETIFFVKTSKTFMQTWTIWPGRQNRWQKAITPRWYPIWGNSQKHLTRWPVSFMNGKYRWRKKRPVRKHMQTCWKVTTSCWCSWSTAVTKIFWWPAWIIRKSSTAISGPPAIHYPMNSMRCVSGILLKKMQTPFRVSRHMNGSGKQKIPFTAFTASRQVWWNGRGRKRMPISFRISPKRSSVSKNSPQKLTTILSPASETSIFWSSRWKNYWIASGSLPSATAIWTI